MWGRGNPGGGPTKLEIVDLTEESLKDAPEWGSHPYSCKYCIYWELPEQCLDGEEENRDEMLGKKLNWLRRTRGAFGNCGKMVYVNRKPVGYAQYAPARFLPHSAQYQSGAPSDDAVLISCLFIPSEKSRDLGVGSRLLRSIIDELRKRGAAAVETFARKSRSDNPSGPIEFYLRNGFNTHRDDPDFPLMRLDL